MEPCLIHGDYVLPCPICLRDERDRYREALEKIADPLPFWEAEAKAKGCRMDGMGIAMLLENPHTFREIARQTLNT